MANTFDSSDAMVREMALLGTAMFLAQKFEFGLYGMIAHLSHTPEAQKQKRFRELTGEKFLRGDPAQLKATLGQLVEQFGDLLAFTTDEVEQFCADRNLIAHNYWRVFHGKIREGFSRRDQIEFLTAFIQQAEHLIKVIAGWFRKITTWMAELQGRTDEFPVSEQDEVNLALLDEHVAKFILKKRSKSKGG